MSTADIIYEKARNLPASQQAEALHFVEYLDSRKHAADEAQRWRQLMAATQAFVATRGITEEAISSEVAGVRSGS